MQVLVWLTFFLLLETTTTTTTTPPTPSAGGLESILTDPDVGKDMVAIVQSKGYPIEEYFVPTRDGYILGVYRIPEGRNISTLRFRHNSEKTPAKPVVLLQHGLLDSSYTWVNNFPNQSLGFILADAGFDVWFGNNRGNTWSKRHAWLSVNSDEFWDFTFDEMAKYDFPDTVNFILNKTGHKQLSYVGHSQGTTQAFAGLSQNKNLTERINILIALGPVASVRHQKSLLLTLLADFDLINIINLFGFREFLPDKTIIQKFAPELCKWVPYGCEDIIFLLTGFSHNLNASRISVYISETPAGTSVKNVMHWTQGVKQDGFQMYDYGCGLFSCKNQEHYGQKTPPQYNLTQVTIPTALYYGGQDLLTEPKDIQILLNSLPNIISKSEQSTYAHLDFTWAVNANEQVYQSVVRQLLEVNNYSG